MRAVAWCLHFFLRASIPLSLFLYLLLSHSVPTLVSASWAFQLIKFNDLKKKKYFESGFFGITFNRLYRSTSKTNPPLSLKNHVDRHLAGQKRLIRSRDIVNERNPKKGFFGITPKFVVRSIKIAKLLMRMIKLRRMPPTAWKSVDPFKSYCGLKIPKIVFYEISISLNSASSKYHINYILSSKMS